jgi:hypothetical protein
VQLPFHDKGRAKTRSPCFGNAFAVSQSNREAIPLAEGAALLLEAVSGRKYWFLHVVTVNHLPGGGCFLFLFSFCFFIDVGLARHEKSQQCAKRGNFSG